MEHRHAVFIAQGTGMDSHTAEEIAGKLRNDEGFPAPNEVIFDFQVVIPSKGREIEGQFFHCNALESARLTKRMGIDANISHVLFESGQFRGLLHGIEFGIGHQKSLLPTILVLIKKIYAICVISS